MKSKNITIKIIILITIIFLLNIIWEVSHYSLYIDMSGIPKYSHLLIASFGDLFFISFIFLIVSLKNKNIKWIEKPSKIDYLLIIILSLATAIFIELRALNIGRWAYTSAMPTIFNIGLSPLIQLAVTSMTALWAIRIVK